MNYYDYDKDDVAKSIKKAMSEYASPEVVKYLVDERNKKIASDRQYAQYKNDSVTKSANEYIDRYSGATSDEITSLYQARSDIAAKNLQQASERNLEIYRMGLAANEDKYNNVKKDMYSAYRRNLLGNEETLAASGLGRGISNKPSSGFGETSRMAQNIAYNNSLYDLYNSKNEADSILAAEYMSGEREAQNKYNDTMEKLAQQRIEQENSNREHRLELDKSRTQLAENAYEKMFDMMKFESDEEQRAFENSLAEKQFISEQERDLYERAYELFKSVGSVVSAQMAQILGIPVGTKYWEYVIEAKNADTSYLNYTVKSQNAATSAAKAATDAKIKQLNYEVAKQNADTNRYKAETDRMKFVGEY